MSKSFFRIKVRAHISETHPVQSTTMLRCFVYFVKLLEARNVRYVLLLNYVVVIKSTYAVMHLSLIHI